MKTAEDYKRERDEYREMLRRTLRLLHNLEIGASQIRDAERLAGPGGDVKLAKKVIGDD